MFNIPREARDYRGWIAIDEARDGFQAPATTLGDLIVSGGINPFSVSRVMRYASAESDHPDSHPMFSAAWQPPGFRRRRRSGGVSAMARSMAARSAAARSAAGRGGMSDLWEELRKTGGTTLDVFTQKADRLENAIKIIMALSGVAAVTGVLTLIRK